MKLKAANTTVKCAKKFIRYQTLIVIGFRPFFKICTAVKLHLKTWFLFICMHIYQSWSKRSWRIWSMPKTNPCVVQRHFRVMLTWFH